MKRKKKYRAIEQLRQRYGGAWVSDHRATWTCTEGPCAGRSVEARAVTPTALYWTDTNTVALVPVSPWWRDAVLAG